MSAPFRTQAEVDAGLRRVLGSIPEPRMSREFESRLAAQLRLEPARRPHTIQVSAGLIPRRRWILRLYWAGAAIVVAATIDAPALEPMQVQGVVAAGGVIIAVLQRIMHPWSLARVMRDALR